MTQREIRKRLDEIIAFAEVDQFLDTPVKQYSSGMYMRLAFAVAAHLEPEILIVDEVLAVGDADFQKKCLGKMDDVSRREGRTVLLVSHNLAAVSELAHRTLLLDSGRIIVDGPTAQAISTYVSKRESAATYIAPDKPATTPYVSRVDVKTSDQNGIHEFGKPLELRFWIKHDRPVAKACFSLQIINQFQQAVLQAWAFYPEVQFANEKDNSLLICRFPSLRLNVGQFYLRTHLTGPPQGDVYERLDGICRFEVIRTDKTILWGWHPDDCSHFEDFEWTVDAADTVNKNDGT